MPVFEYTALTVSDRLMKGTIEAGSREEAQQTLRDMQLNVSSVEKARPVRPKTAIGRTEFLLFNRQLASITKTGIPLERALRELSNDIASKKMRKLINEIADDLEAGTDIVQAFEKRQKSFPPLYGRILKAGIETGRLSEMLASLNRNLEVSGRTRRIVFEATAYPVVVLVIASVIFSGALLFIVPGFETVLNDMLDGEINPLTNLFFTMSRNIFGIWTVVAGCIAAVVAFLFWLNSFTRGRRLKESFYLRIPVFGRLYHSSVLAKMAESSAMLVASGADMPTVLRLGSNASGSEKLILESDIVAEHIERGSNVLEAGQFCRMIPKLFLYSIQLAGQRNELQDSLHNLSQMYSEQVRCWQMRLQTILLPVMLVLVGGFLFITISAMFLPIITAISCIGM